MEHDSKPSRTGNNHEPSLDIEPCWHCNKRHKGTCWTQSPSRAPRWWVKKFHRRIEQRNVDVQKQRFHPFMRLPAELRVKIYEYYFQPGRFACEHWGFGRCNNPQCASTGKEIIRRPYHCWCMTCRYSGALLLANNQVRKEALPVLEDTVQLDLGIASIEYVCTGFGWHFGCDNAASWGLPDEPDLARQLEGWVKVPDGIKVLFIHLDTWHLDEDTRQLPALLDQLKHLHFLAERMTFVVDVHVSRVMAGRKVGKRKIFSDDGDSEIEKQTKARDLRKQLVRGLEAEFAKEGKTLRLREA